MDLLIMSRDDIVARWKDRHLEIVNENKLPLYLAKTHNVERWLETRSIDRHRANSRLLIKALRLTEKDDVQTVISVNAATITDSYWVKSPDSTLTYADIRFNDDYFANLALRGDYDSFNKAMNSKNSKTPELTNIGSFEKCWKLTNGEWWMYKTANHSEMFSELFAFELGMALGFNMAEYRREKKFIKTKDFTDHASVNYEPAYSFMSDGDDYIETVGELRALGSNLVPDYVKMIFLDTLIANPDRHTFNFGVLRSLEGKVLGLAPNFDNNMALIARGYPKNISRKNDVLARFFKELLAFDNSLREFLPTVTEDIVWSVLTKMNMKVRSKTIVDFVMNGYRQI